MVSTSFMVDTSSHPRAQLHRCVERSAYRLSTPGEQQAMSHPVPACHPADRLAGLQGLFDKAHLLVLTPSPPTLGAQHIDLHSRRDLKARVKVKSLGRPANYTRRSPPEGYSLATDSDTLYAPAQLRRHGENRKMGLSRREWGRKAAVKVRSDMPCAKGV